MENVQQVRLAKGFQTAITQWLKDEVRLRINQKLQPIVFYTGIPKDSDMFRLVLTVPENGDTDVHANAIFLEELMDHPFLKTLEIETTVEVDATTCRVFFFPSAKSVMSEMPDYKPFVAADVKSHKQRMLENRMHTLVDTDYKKHFQEWDPIIQSDTINSAVILVVKVDLNDSDGITRLEALFEHIKTEVTTMTINTLCHIFIHESFYTLTVAPCNAIEEAS